MRLNIKLLQLLLCISTLLCMYCWLYCWDNTATTATTAAAAAAAVNLQQLTGDLAQRRESSLHAGIRVPALSSSVCHTPQCIAAFEASLTAAGRGGTPRVPKIRHILWKTDRISGYFANQLKTWADIHPDWKYILWRDTDLDWFVSKHYPEALGKFRMLPQKIMKIDMIRYLILHHFGGVYADLDYVLSRPLDRFLKFPAVVTRETEVHALAQFGMRYPPPLLGNPAFMMSAPGHPFFRFAVAQLVSRPALEYYSFAGPLGLSDLLAEYAREFPVPGSGLEAALIVPASRSFYAFEGNRMPGTASGSQEFIVGKLRQLCRSLAGQPAAAVTANLTAYCSDVTNLDPITDRNEPVYAIHDYRKQLSSYSNHMGMWLFDERPVHIRSILPGVLMANSVA